MHSFRHVCGTNLRRAGMKIEDLRDFLGHDDIETTQVYCELTKDDLREASHVAYAYPKSHLSLPKQQVKVSFDKNTMQLQKEILEKQLELAKLQTTIMRSNGWSAMSICNNKRYEKEFVKKMLNEGWHCERVAGSGSGQEAVCNCVLFRDGEIFLVEVKATKEAKFYEHCQIKEQLDRMLGVAKKSHVRAILAIKFKHRGWEERVLL